MFVTKDVNAAGIYMVKMFINGNEQPVIVDDYLPCKRNGSAAFATSRDGELWGSILEKAWAKLHGSYERIEAGFAENVLRDLTGAPTEVIETSDETLWDRVQQADQRDWIMAASAGTTGASVDALEKLGLIGFHAYGLLKAVTIEDRFGDEV